MLNSLDILLIIVLIWAIRSSVDVGLIQEAFTLVGLLLGIFVAGQLYRVLARTLFGPAPDNLALGVTFLATVLGVWFGATFAGRLMHEAVHLIKLGWIDRLGGLFFGAIKGVLLIEVLIIVFARFPVLNTEELVKNSQVAAWLAQYTPMIMGLLPREFQRITDLMLN